MILKRKVILRSNFKASKTKNQLSNQKLKFSFSSISICNRIWSKSWYKKRYRRLFQHRNKEIVGFQFSRLTCKKLKYKLIRTGRSNPFKELQMNKILIWVKILIIWLSKKKKIAIKKQKFRITITHRNLMIAISHPMIISDLNYLANHLEFKIR